MIFFKYKSAKNCQVNKMLSKMLLKMFSLIISNSRNYSFRGNLMGVSA